MTAGTGPLNPALTRASSAVGLPDPPRAFASGALPIVPDSRLSSFRAASSVMTVLAGGGPPLRFSLEQFVGAPYDQYAGSASRVSFKCVAYSTAAMVSIFCNERYGSWLGFDAEECYARCGGTSTSGIQLSDALNFAINPGFRDAATGHRYPLSSAHVIAPVDNDGEAQVKAAIAAGNPCVLNLLLPQDFFQQEPGSGNCSSTTITNAYHQVCVYAYDDVRFYFLNSEGIGWGTAGKGSIPWALLAMNPEPNWCGAGLCTDDVALPANSSFR